MKHHLPLALSVALAASFLAVTRSLASDSLSWVAGSGTWSDSVSAGWSPSTAVPAGQDVIFAAAGQGTVSVDGTVTPATVAVLGGDYVFQQLAGTVGGIETSGSFSVSGADTRLTLAMENVGMSGEVVLAGGSLVLGEQNATGSATILFNGGSLAYASGVTRNLGELVGTGSTSVVRVDTGDNDVTWGNRNASNIPGFVAALSNGIEKSGSGMLSLLEIQGSAGSYAGDISVLGGRLNIYADYATGSAGSSAAIVLNGDISVAEGAWLSLGTTFDSSNSNRMTLAGSLGGSGTVEIGNPENVHAGAENKAGGGRYAIRGDNSAFAGTLRLSGLPASATLLYNGAEFASDAAVGGSASTLQLNGRQFWILETRSVHSLPMAVELVDGSNTVFHPNANQIYNFTGALTGGGTLSGLDGRAATVQFSGDIAACSGSLVSGSSNVFLLGGSDAVSPGGDINMSLGGSGLFVINYSSAVTLAGSFQGAASLQQSGAGVLTLVSSSSSTGALVVDAGCVLNIGSASRSATWAGGSVAGLGTLVLVNGGLTENLGMPTVQIVVDAAAGASVSAGGTDGSFLSSITLPAGSSLTGVSGDISAGGSGLQSLDLTLTEANVGSGVAAAAKIDQGDATLSLSTGAAIRVALSPDALVDTLVAHDDAGVESYLTLTSGTLEVADLADVVVSPFLENYGLRVVRTEGGSLVVSGRTQGLYYVTADAATTDPHEVDAYAILGLYAGVIVERDQALTVSLPGAPADASKPACINNLTGGSGSLLSVENSGSGTAVLVLNNSLLDTRLDTPATIGADSEMAGSVAAGRGVQLVKSGAGSLSVSGAFSAEMLRLENGALELAGEGDNRISVLSDAVSGASLSIARNATLQLSGASALSLSSLSGPGTLDLSGSLSLAGSASLQDLSLVLPASGQLDIGSTGEHRLSAINGAGSISAAGSSLRLVVGDSVFSGSLSGSGNNVLAVAAGASLVLDHVVCDRSWSVDNAGSLVLDTAGASSNKSLTLGSLSLGAGSTTTLVINTDVATESAYLLSVLTVDDAATLVLKSTGEFAVELDAKGQLAIGLVAENSSVGKVPLELEGVAAFKQISSAWLSVENNLLMFNAIENNTNSYTDYADSPNALAGAELMWNAPDRVLSLYPGLKALDEALFELVRLNKRAEANELMVALSGAAATVQGAAFCTDMERQLRAMRNRSVRMGEDPCLDYQDLPHWHFWVNAEGNFYRRDADGSNCGYSLNNWGGSIGASFDCDQQFSVGGAFSAMAGDLCAKGHGFASDKGDLLTYYASLMVRAACDAWAHSFVLCLGWAESDFRRFVSYEGGAYHAKGRTDGFGVGLLYELSCSIPLDEDGRMVLQPIANVSFSRTSLGAYSEHGADAALRFGEQNLRSWEFGLGARWQSPIAETLSNRSVLAEFRALVKCSSGDRYSATESAFVHIPGYKVAIRCADRRSVGVELGGGLAVPLDVDGGVLFMDASALLQSSIYDFNAVVGYRKQF